MTLSPSQGLLYEARRNAAKQADCFSDRDPTYEESQVERCERALALIGAGRTLDACKVNDVTALLAERAEWLAQDCPAGCDALTASDYQEAIDEVRGLVTRIREAGSVPARDVYTVRDILRDEVLPRLLADLDAAKRAAEYAADVWGDTL